MIPRSNRIVAATYRGEVIRGMQLLASDPTVIFCGQGVGVKANCIFEQLEGVPMERRLEVPVFENTQLGMCLGMALAGLTPVCIYPRLNFLYCCWDQLVNHVDKWGALTGRSNRLIIKTMTGVTRPLDPGPQHSGGEDFVAAIDDMLEDVDVQDLDDASKVYAAYETALKWPGPTLLIERGNLYG